MMFLELCLSSQRRTKWWVARKVTATPLPVLQAGLAYRYWPIFHIGRYSPYRQNRYISIGRYKWKRYLYAWILIKARILADSIGRYIGYDKSISAYRLSVKFHRYANPGYKYNTQESIVLQDLELSVKRSIQGQSLTWCDIVINCGQFTDDWPIHC